MDSAQIAEVPEPGPTGILFCFNNVLKTPCSFSDNFASIPSISKSRKTYIRVVVILPRQSPFIEGDAIGPKPKRIQIVLQ